MERVSGGGRRHRASRLPRRAASGPFPVGASSRTFAGHTSSRASMTSTTSTTDDREPADGSRSKQRSVDPETERSGSTSASEDSRDLRRTAGPTQVLGLQRAAGNRAVSRSIRSRGNQPRPVPLVSRKHFDGGGGPREKRRRCPASSKLRVNCGCCWGLQSSLSGSRSSWSLPLRIGGPGRT